MSSDRDLITEAREMLSRTAPGHSMTSDPWTAYEWTRANLPALLDELEAQRARVNELAAQRNPDDEVLVEGSWFHPADLPKILGNFMRASDEYARDAKDAWIELEQLRAERERELAVVAAKQQRDDARIAELEADLAESRAVAGQAHGNAGALHARAVELRARVDARDARIGELEAKLRRAWEFAEAEMDDLKHHRKVVGMDRDGNPEFQYSHDAARYEVLAEVLKTLDR